MAGGFTDNDERWDSRRAAAYPPAFCSLIARRLRNLRFGDAALADSGSAPSAVQAKGADGTTQPHVSPAVAGPPPPSLAAPDAEGEPAAVPPPPPAPTPRVAEAFPIASPPLLEEATPAIEVSAAPRRLPKTNSGDATDNTSRAFAHGPSSRTRHRRGSASALSSAPTGRHGFRPLPPVAPTAKPRWRGHGRPRHRVLTRGTIAKQ